MLAARTGSVDVASKLIAAGADVNAREAWRDQTALMWAAEGAFPELVDLLIEHGADVRARAAANDWGSQITSEPRAQYRPTGGLTPLLYAARSGCTDCVRSILAAGEAVDRPTPDGVTALMLAIDNYEFDTAKALLDSGANPHLSDWWGRTALYLAVDMNTYVPRGAAVQARSKSTTGMDLVSALLAAGVEVNPQLNFHRPGRGGNSARFVDDLLTTGATPLLRAAIMHDDEAMRALLAAGARVDVPNVMGVTPLMAAAGIGVREPGFGANRAPNFTSPSIESETIASLEILLAAGADVNAADHGHPKPHGAHRAAELDDGSAGPDGAALGRRARLGRGRRLPARARREPGVERRARPHAARSRDDARAGPPRAERGAQRRAAEGRRRRPATPPPPPPLDRHCAWRCGRPQTLSDLPGGATEQ